MAETRYHVIFNGELAEGQQIEEVKKRLAAAYKCDVAKIERTFFAGKMFIAKKDVDYETAVKVHAALNRTGGIFEIRPITPPAPAKTTPPVVAAAPIAPKTPEKPITHSPKPTPIPAKPAKRRGGKLAFAMLLLLLMAGTGVGLYQFGLLDAQTLGRISKGVKDLTARAQKSASTNDVAATTNNAPEAEEVEAVNTLPTAFANASFSIEIPGIRNGIVPVNDYLDVSWKAKGNLVSPGDETYEFIVFSMPNTVRFKGTGFLMLPPETTLPFGFKLNDDRLRVLFPLYLLKDATQGAFQVRPLLAGDFTLQWEYVTVKKNGQIEQRSSQAAQEPQTVTFEVRDMRPQIIVQDKVGIETPEQVIVSPSGEYEARVFKERFQLLYAKTGDMIFERNGQNPTFSPESRFLCYNTLSGLFQTIDLLSQELVLNDSTEELIWTAGNEVLSWQKNDTFLITNRYSPLEENNTLTMILPFLDDNNTIDYELCLRCSVWKDAEFTIDVENALLRAKSLFVDSRLVDINKPIYDYDGKLSYGNSLYSLLDIKKKGKEYGSYNIAKEYDSPYLGLFGDGGFGFLDTDNSKVFKALNLPIYRNPPKGWEILTGNFLFVPKEDIPISQKLIMKPILRNQAIPNVSIIAGLNTDKGVIRGDTISVIQNSSFKGNLKNNKPNEILKRLSDIGLQFQYNLNPSIEESEESTKDPILQKFLHGQFEKEDDVCGSEEVTDIGFAGMLITHQYWENKGNKFLFTRADCRFEIGAGPNAGRTSIGSELFLTASLENNVRYNISIEKVFIEKVKEHEFARKYREEYDKNYDFSKLTDEELVYRFMALSSFEPATEIKSFYTQGNILSVASIEGNSFFVFDLLKQQPIAFIPNVLEINALQSVYISEDEQLLLQTNQDGHFYLYDIQAEKRIPVSGLYIDDEIILYTDDGFYDGTLEGVSFVTWHYPGLQTHFNFAQFESQFERPDIIQALLAGKPVEQPAIKLVPPPNVELVVNHAGNYAPQVTVEVSASSILSLKNMRLFVNGAPAAEIPASGKTATHTLTLDLQRGKQWITAVAYNSRGYSSTPKSVLLDAAKVNAPGGALYVVGVGVNAYPKMPENNLAYAVNDVTAFADALKANPNKQYEKVLVQNLSDAQATAANIRQALTETIRQATANDTIMLYFSGHGGKGGDDKFYFLTPDASFDDLEQTGLRWEEVASLLAQAKAKVFVFLDACHSGAASQTTFTPNDAYVAELMKSGKAGMAILASSKGRQSSYEDDDLKHGLFNYAITQAFGKNRKQTDANQDGVIELSELYRSVKFQVNQLSEGDQTPWLSRNEIIGETPLL